MQGAGRNRRYLTVRSDASGERLTKLAGVSIERPRKQARRVRASTLGTSSFLVAFGFAVHEVSQPLARNGVLQEAGIGQQVGLSLLIVGVVMLCLDLRVHRRAAVDWTKPGAPDRATPAMIGTVLMLAVGLGCLAWILVPML